MNTFLLKEWKNTFCHCWMWRRKLTAGSWISSCPPLESAGLHEDQWRAEQRRQIKAGIPEALAEYICRYIEEYRSRGHLWHFTHFLKAGAQRIGVTRYTDKIEVTAFEKDGRITVVLLNRTEEEIPVYLRLGEYCAELTSKAKSIMTAEIEK